MLRRAAPALLLLVALLAPTADAEWASFRGDSRNSGAVGGTDYEVYKDVWWSNRSLGEAQVKASPVLKDGILITADLGPRVQTTLGKDGSMTTSPVANPIGIVRALDAESGKELWRHSMTGPVESTPAISGERVYAVDTKGVLRALNLRTGAVEHEYKTHGATLAPITLHENKLFLGTEAGEMRAYLASTLTPLWTFKTSEYGSTGTYSASTDLWTCGSSARFSAQPIRSGVAVFDNKVFFGSMNHYVFALDEEGQGNLKTTIKWVYKTGDIVLATPSINLAGGSLGRLIVGSYDGKVYSFVPSPPGEGSNGCNGLGNNTLHNPSWNFPVPNVVDPSTGQSQVSKVYSSPATQGDRIYVGANNGKVYALDAANQGQLLWEATAGSVIAPVTSSPVLANGIVVVGSEDKSVYWINATDGKVLKKFTTQSAVVTSPAIDGKRAFVASQDGTLYMFGPEIPRRADLTVTSVSGSVTTVTVNIKNLGDAATSGNTTVRLFVGGTFLANVDVPKLEPGAATNVQHEAIGVTGSVQLRALVDPDNTIAESNDSNNEMTSAVALGDPAAPTDGQDGGDEGDGGGFKIPGPGLVPVLAMLGLALLALRRRR
ncbi:MAG TPA: PQQ-binding-like beta-propeller repeat protein [Candidatus Thermoplasmatota archaeon]|nr:PQQ-binding-like beta-propeller repeat protein [Candidatus Thermoplasmatota archaeon]